MTRMHHEHVVRLYGVVLDMKKVMMVSGFNHCLVFPVVKHYGSSWDVIGLECVVAQSEDALAVACTLISGLLFQISPSLTKPFITTGSCLSGKGKASNCPSTAHRISSYGPDKPSTPRYRVELEYIAYSKRDSLAQSFHAATVQVSELATCGSLLECLHKPALRDSFPIHVLCDYAEQIAKV